jgi:hypothetical protein
MAPLLDAAAEPSGPAFSIPDLMIARGWADFHDLTLTVELDHCIEGADYEEVLAFHHQGVRRWAMWRSKEQVVVAGRRGATCRFESLPEALEAIEPQAVVAPV